MRGFILATVMVLAVWASGCGSAFGRSGAAPPKPVDQVVHIDLFAVPPAAVNWDDVPGPDGVLVRVFLYQADRAAPVLVTGTLELMMYEGRLATEDFTTAQPFRVWRFNSQDLVMRQERGMAGWGYGAQLGWSRQAPASPTVTVVARYLPPQGPAAYSTPVVIPVGK